MNAFLLQGTNQQQDTRFSDKEKKLLKQMKFGDCLNQRVTTHFYSLSIKQKRTFRLFFFIFHFSRKGRYG